MYPFEYWGSTLVSTGRDACMRMCVRACAYTMGVALPRALMSLHIRAALCDRHVKAKHHERSTRAAIIITDVSLNLRARIRAYIYRTFIFLKKKQLVLEAGWQRKRTPTAKPP